MDDFQGSIAQENVAFSTGLSYETVPGDNYYKLLVFVGLSQAGESLVTVPVAETLYSFTSSSFVTETKGLLNKWLTAFYANAGNASVIVVVWDDETAGVWDGAKLAPAYAKYKDLAYWKAMLYYEVTGDVPDLATQDLVAYTALATLQKADTGLTGPILVNEYDVAALTAPATTISGSLKAATLDAFSVYHYDALNKAPAFVQLGITLGSLNESGTPVGNSFDFVATGSIDASGAAGTNLTGAQKTVLETANIGYFKTIGNGTGRVALIGGIALLGSVISAIWIVMYNDYVNEIKVAELITKMNVFKNAVTYSLILAQMSAQLSRFSDNGGTGRLTQLKILAPTFNKLPVSAGDTITVPNAWQALYVDNVRSVLVQGSLTISA